MLSPVKSLKLLRRNFFLTCEKIVLDGRSKRENVQQNLFDGIFCYKLPIDIFLEYRK
jgi:hypothetical protein